MPNNYLIMKKKNNKSGYVNSGYIIAGCTMLGMGLGHFFGNMKAFMFMGIGLGLVGLAVVQISFNLKDEEDEA